MSTQPVLKLTPEQCLEIERKAAINSEYFQGEMLAMPGASARHDDIAGSLLSALKGKLRGLPCRVTPAICGCKSPRPAPSHIRI